MKRKLICLVLGSCLALGGCGNLGRLIEISQEQKYGMKDYYSPQEKKEQRLEFENNMYQVNELGKKYKN